MTLITPWRCSMRTSPGGRGRIARLRDPGVAGTNHFTVLDPLSDPRSAMTKRLAELVPAI